MRADSTYLSLFVSSDVQRSFVGGCYDPIIASTTVLGACLSQKHCDALPNTVCEDFDGDGPRCVCAPDTEPLARDPNTGLTPGCAPTPNRLKAVPIEMCAKRFSLDVRKVR